ncbi:hypothetical protein LTR36_008868 [Oleoguttula mirabilis]|uniref:TIR domain-containing protein n=1 Tax=Oleoguttula mirabilis TaxID=1507867 RepID=A0AAV9J7X9_9PEZI|nr:hypothetical protein LTR36_008868 [Oleoguttula mirabilis]
MQTSAFISYSTRDQEDAFDLQKILQEDGVNVWLDVINIRVTNQLTDELKRNIATHDVFCLLLSPSSVSSDWVLEEIRLHRELIAKDELLEQANEAFPAILEQIAALCHKPMRRIQLQRDMKSLPDDPNIILELSLKRDLYTGPMSIFIARYREGHTWPASFAFEEPEYTEFFLVDVPRIVVMFRWDEITERLSGTIADRETYHASYTMELDGREVRPGNWSLPAKLEFPSLETTDGWETKFVLIAHNTATGDNMSVGEEIDIRIELAGTAGDSEIRLYRSFTSYKQSVLLGSKLLSALNPIHREATLAMYDSTGSVMATVHSAATNQRPPLETALGDIATDWDTLAFESDGERLCAGRALFERANASFVKEAWRDAYKMSRDTTDLLYPLCKKLGLGVRERTMAFVCALRLVTIWLQQGKVGNSEMVVQVPEILAYEFAKDHPDEPDYRRFGAECAVAHAKVHAKMGRKTAALAMLGVSISIYAEMHSSLGTRARRAAWLLSLAQAVKSESWGNGDWAID